MRKLTLLTLILFLANIMAYAGTGAIPSGPDIKMLKNNIRFKNGNVRIMAKDTDSPAAVAKDGDEGSLYIQDGTGYLFWKQDAGSSTNWLQVLVSASGTDECIPRYDGTGVPLMQDSVVCVTDAGIMSGATQLNVDNLRLDGNTISSIATNIVLDAADGNINLPDLTASRPLKLDASKNVISSQIDLASTNDVTGLLPISNGGTNSSTALNNSRMMVSLGGEIVEAGALTNGQVFIGSTGAAPVAANIIGSVNRVTVNNGIGSITLTGPQDIHTGATPTFSDLVLSSFTANSVLFAGAGGAVSEDNANFSWTDGTDTLGVTGLLTIDNLSLDGNTIASTDVNGDVVLNPNGTGAVNLPDLTISQPAYINASGDLVSQDLDLTTDITGILPTANGGTGVNSTATFPTSGVVLTASAVQDVSFKTFLNALTIQELAATPANPPAGDKKIYCLSGDNKCYHLNSAGLELELGGSGSGSVSNFVTNPGAEVNTTGWATYLDSVAGTPIDGTGGAPTNTLTRNTTTPITGAGDFQYTKGASTLGEGFSYDFTIGASDPTKIITIDFDFDTSHVNYALGYLRVYIYNKDSAILEESTVRDIPQGVGSYTAYFQSADTDTNYRLILHVSDVAALAWNAYIDNVTVSPGDSGDLFSPVRIKYQSSDGQSLSTGVDTDITYENIVYDSHSAFATGTGIFTAPRKINCIAHAEILFSGASSWNVGEVVTGRFDCLACNPSAVALRVQEDDTFNIGTLALTDHFELNQGDTVKFIANQNSGASATLTSTNADNTISLECK